MSAALRIKPGLGTFVLREGSDASLLTLPGRAAPLMAYSFDPNAEFSINDNPHGVWTYGYMGAGFGVFTTLSLTYFVSPFMGWSVLNGGTPWVIVFRNIANGTTAGIPPGGLALHPMPNATPGVLRWTSPAEFARLRVKGSFLPGDVSLTSVAIRRGSTMLFTAVDSGDFDLILSSVAKGETLDFCAYGTTTSSSTPLNLIISGDGKP